MTEHQGSPPGSGMAGQPADVRDCLPPDKDALGLVEAILEETRFTAAEYRIALEIRLSIIQDDAERLKTLLEERDAAVQRWLHHSSGDTHLCSWECGTSRSEVERLFPKAKGAS